MLSWPHSLSHWQLSDPPENHCRTANQGINLAKKWLALSEFSPLNQLYQGQMNGTGSSKCIPGSGEWDPASGAAVIGLLQLKTQ